MKSIFHLKLPKPKEPELTEEDKTVVSQTDNYFQLWHGTPNEQIAGNKIDEEEMSNLFGEDVTHFVKHTTKGNGLYQLPPGSSGCTIVTKDYPLYRWDAPKINFRQGKEDNCVYSSFCSAFHHCGWITQAETIHGYALEDLSSGGKPFC